MTAVRLVLLLPLGTLVHVLGHVVAARRRGVPVELVNGRVSFGWGTSMPRQRLAVVRAGPLAQIRYGAAVAVVSMLGRWSPVDKSALLVIGLAQIARGVYAVRSTRHADGREIRRMLAELERDRASSSVARHLSPPGVGGPRTRWLVLWRFVVPVVLVPLWAVSAWVSSAHGVRHGTCRVVSAAEEARAERLPPLYISEQVRAAPLHFAPDVPPSDRRWILAAIARARPEAQRLIGEVDGLVTVTAQVQNRGALGETQRVWLGSGYGFHIDLRLASLDGRNSRHRDFAVLHELGHVIDFAVIPPALDTELNAGIPIGAHPYFARSVYGACAPPTERIADTFAKWALRGATPDHTGYDIPPPSSLEDWGAPLAALARDSS